MREQIGIVFDGKEAMIEKRLLIEGEMGEREGERERVREREREGETRENNRNDGKNWQFTWTGTRLFNCNCN